MWSSILDWAFHWILLWIAFELGKRWNEKEVHAAIAAITETQSRRISDNYEKVSLQITAIAKLLGPLFATNVETNFCSDVCSVERAQELYCALRLGFGKRSVADDLRRNGKAPGGAVRL